MHGEFAWRSYSARDGLGKGSCQTRAEPQVIVMHANQSLQHACSRRRHSVIPADDENPKLVCCLCLYNWCRTCKVEWHEGKTCNDPMNPREVHTPDLTAHLHTKPLDKEVCRRMACCVYV